VPTIVTHVLLPLIAPRAFKPETNSQRLAGARAAGVGISVADHARRNHGDLV
jgi:hypothetical protein